MKPLMVAVNVELSDDVRREVEDCIRRHGGEVVFTKDLKSVEVPPTVIFGGASAEYVAHQKDLRWLQTAWAGVDPLFMGDIPLRSDLILTSGSGVYGPAGGEHILGMMLHFARGFPFYLANQCKGEWVRDISHARLLKDRTLVLLGLGDLGSHVARRAKAFDMHVIGVKRTPGEVDHVDRVVTTDQLDEVLPLGDHVAVTLPLTRETKGLIDRRRLSLMKNGAYIYNIGRGPIIDEDALVDALRSGRLAGAGLDVFQEEPLPEGYPLWHMENVIITPHIGADTPWDADGAARIFMENVDRYMQGEPMRNVVDPTLGY